MIPKKIHYCWFGRAPLPNLALKCIASWKKFCPDYEFCFWNEDNFDVTQTLYTKEAYENRKYAFVTDYVRLWAIYNYGGIYMDIDVEVLKPLDRFLVHPAFSGFESSELIPTGIMGSEQSGIWAKNELKYYRDRHFIKLDGRLDLTTNVEIITKNLANDGFLLNNSYQEHKGIIVMYPCEYFCPISPFDRKLRLTRNSHTIHHFSGSWLTPWQKVKMKVKPLVCRLGLYSVVKKNLGVFGR